MIWINEFHLFYSRFAMKAFLIWVKLSTVVVIKPPATLLTATITTVGRNHGLLS